MFDIAVLDLGKNGPTFSYDLSYVPFNPNQV